VDARVLRRGLPDNGYAELPIVSDHFVAIEGLPTIHKDPFDCVLVAQANRGGYYSAYDRSFGSEVSPAIRMV